MTKLISLLVLLSCGICMFCAHRKGVVLSGTVSGIDCLLASYKHFAIFCSDSIGVVPSTLTYNLQLFKDTGFNGVILYLYPCMECHPVDQIRDVCDKIAGMLQEYRPKVLVSIEPSYFSSSKEANIRYLHLLVSAVDSETRCFSGLDIMSSRFTWNKVFGESYHGFHLHPLYWIDLDKDPTKKGWLPFGGWISPSEKLYEKDVTTCSNYPAGLLSYDWT